VRNLPLRTAILSIYKINKFSTTFCAIFPLVIFPKILYTYNCQEENNRKIRSIIMKKGGKQ